MTIDSAVQTKRQRLELLYSELVLERSSFLNHWQEIGEQVAPRRPRFYTTDVNRGDRRNGKIIDTSPVLSARSLRAGMMSGITSPARPWFKLTIADFDVTDDAAVKDWLDSTTLRMNSVFSRSNLYNVLLNIYGDIGTFGTSSMLIEEDFDYVIRCFSIPIGSYVLGVSDKLKVQVFMREFQMTVRQIVEKFGRDKDTGEINWDNISLTVKNHWEQNRRENQFDVVHAITPNDDYDPKKLGSEFKKFASTYYERGNQSNANSLNDDKLLQEKGYDYFPVLAPRWETTGQDIYGTACPGMDGLGDFKQLQLGERRLAQAIEMLVKPPMKGPTSLKSTTAGIIPGKITYVDERGDQGGFKPVFQIEPKVQELENKQQQLRDRIRRIFFEDLFLMMSQSDRKDITAREIDERHEEKLLALGPVLEQLNQDLLDPLIEITFNFMNAQGMIDPPPQQIQGAPVKVEYISIMAQAQKLAGLASIDRFSTYVQNLAAVDPSVLDTVDTGVLVSEYAETTSMRAKVIRPDAQVQQIRQQRAQSQAAQQKADMMMKATQGAKNLSQADMSGDNALSRMVQQSNAGSPVGPSGVATG